MSELHHVKYLASVMKLGADPCWKMLCQIGLFQRHAESVVLLALHHQKLSRQESEQLYRPRDCREGKEAVLCTFTCVTNKAKRQLLQICPRKHYVSSLISNLTG